MLYDLRNIDCLELLKTLPDKSIDLMLQDIPYGTTQNKWDMMPDLTAMWVEWKRVIKDDGIFVFTAQQPCTSELVLSNKAMFKCDWIWMKEKGTGHLNANKYPLRNHEHILIFANTITKYNPQFERGKPYQRLNGSKNALNKGNYGTTKESYSTTSTDGDRFPQTIQFFASDSQRFGSLHPTQKPEDLMRYFLLTYSNEGDTVFDGYSGSGTTAVACIEHKRNFIGAELNPEYFTIAKERIENAQLQTSLF